MRRLLGLISALSLMAGALPLAAQGTGTLPASRAAQIARMYNATAALRATGALDIPKDQTVTGDVAVLSGPVTLAGHITGRVLVINGDVTLREGATIDGDLVVVGGTITGQERATIGGELDRYVQQMRYHLDGDRVVADEDRAEDRAGSQASQDSSDEARENEGWIRRWKRRRDRSYVVPLILGGAYNRVEGLPVELGPSFRARGARSRLRVDVLGIIRSVNSFEWTTENLGHDVNAELQLGRDRHFAIGGRLFDIVDPTERWQLRDAEVGLASFFFHRDYRDYYGRHGGNGFVAVSNGHGADLTLTYGDEVWHDRREHSPFSVFSGDASWRPNPIMDAGRFHVADAQLVVDTRSDPSNPRSGWLLVADIEHGTSNASRLAPTSPSARQPAPGPVPVQYTRGLLDLRRYNRVSPTSQFNLRLVLGGWLGGDELPLQRRFSVGGAGTLPGFDFRRVPEGVTDKFQCSDGSVALPGAPAQCERIALAQLEYRGALVYDRSQLPPLDTFEGDVGVGLDFDFIGFFIAKSVTQSQLAPNFFVRLRHRF